jgi:serine/threonine protein kinase
MVRSEPYSKKVDIWCLGVIFYCLLKGVLPFNSESNDNKEIARKIMGESPNMEGINQDMADIILGKKILRKLTCL